MEKLKSCTALSQPAQSDEPQSAGAKLAKAFWGIDLVPPTQQPAQSRNDVIEECAKVADEFSFAVEITKWMEMTKKGVSALTCTEIAAALRALKDGGRTNG